MTEEAILARIAELDRYRQEIITQVNLELSRVSGGIIELQKLLTILREESESGVDRGAEQ